MSKFAKRSTQKELMDDLECSGAVLEETLRELKTVNRWLGGNYVTTSGLSKFLEVQPKAHFTIADIGCGGGDMVRLMCDWAKKQVPTFDFIGIDANPHVISFAEKRNPGSNIRYQVQNVFDREFREEQVDIVTCTLFTHHFTDEELIRLFQALKDKAKVGFLINDLHRHALAYHSIRWIVNAFSKSPMVRNDAPLSVWRSFRKEDWERIFSQVGIENYEITWHWAFRWRVFVLI